MITVGSFMYYNFAIPTELSRVSPQSKPRQRSLLCHFIKTSDMITVSMRRKLKLTARNRPIYCLVRAG